ncbi:SAM-dependent DNA methyltransferase [Prevotella cerevisiae]|uniref:SAM-dependent DNA methyltransferase n=1 Tax=Segatella cerevisiae TaxID=2053716 RepID=A0ABT1BUU1_9BACT|nr:SAM-dependent DNA methyltransferase [Segatella cerevisiae]MCO6024856.1 SAM-dependent DNA methyltransferase [Segatella cerevisiae]
MRKDDSHTQIKSRERVSNHGEVFTAPREVNAMLDLVKGETERIDSRFLEPACGTGNFVTVILERKLRVARQLYAKDKVLYELNALIAVGSIYGIELLQDNVKECRNRLSSQFKNEYLSVFPQGPNPGYFQSIDYIFYQNILWGDALTLKTPEEHPVPIVFSEWTVINGQIKRRDYTMANLMENQPMEGPNLFSDLGDEAFIPTPIKEFPLTNYLKIAEYEELQS